MRPKVLFLTLQIFSATGGIEKVCKIVGKALYEIGLKHGWTFNIFSMHGKKNNADENNYFPQINFNGFAKYRIKYVLNSIRVGRRAEIVLLSHVNLLLPGVLIKLFKPSVKLVLLAHGIEVWKPFSFFVKRMINKCDLILTVSHFTKDKMHQMHGIPHGKFKVLNNCLDPFLEKPLDTKKSETLLDRYKLKDSHQILMTVARMTDTELYKGYDKVIKALPALINEYPMLHYLLVGKYTTIEKQRIDELIIEQGVAGKVTFAGFVPDKELAVHFNLADIFIMPSEKEGFGIVFIEAMFYGKPVIAGNKDGSVDALLNGELGLLINPEEISEIGEAIKKILANPKAYIPDSEKLQHHFGYTGYKRKLEDCIMN